MQIRIKTGTNKGKVVPVIAGQPIMIGRDSTCGLQVIDRGVSREHAKIVRMGEMVFLHDLESRNGSFVNGERVKEELLREGDTIRVGATQLVFENARNGKREGDDLLYDDNDGAFKSSLELNVNDLYVMECNSPARESDHFRAICQATTLLQNERDEKKLYAKLLELLMEYIPAGHAYVFIKNDQTGMVAPMAIKSKGDAHKAPISRSILRKVIGESKAILTADATQDERFNSGASIVANNIRSLICVPLSSGSHTHGAIYAVNSSLTEAFDQSDLQLVSNIGTHLAVSLDNLHLTVRRRKVYFRIIGRLLSNMEGLPIGVAGHAERVCGYCMAISVELGLSDRDSVSAALGGLLHDLGKLPAAKGMAESVADYVSGTGCANVAAEMLKDIPDLDDALNGVQSQFENFDGTGFPQRLKGKDIPVAGRIVAVASAFDKLIYKDGVAPPPFIDSMAIRAAFENLQQRADKMYDPEVVNALMVAFRHGALTALKSAPVPLASELSAQVDPAKDAMPVEVSGTTADSLRKKVAAISRQNTIRLSRDGRAISPGGEMPPETEVGG